jgi:hypothetical protein
MSGSPRRSAQTNAEVVMDDHTQRQHDDLVEKVRATRASLTSYNPAGPLVDLLLDVRSASPREVIIEVVDAHLSAMSHRQLLAAAEVIPVLDQVERCMSPSPAEWKPSPQAHASPA